MIETNARIHLMDQDKLGKNETFEARIRGALSPYSTLIEMLNDDRFDLIKYQDIFNKLKDRKHLDRILELLKYSELDREELENNINENNKTI